MPEESSFEYLLGLFEKDEITLSSQEFLVNIKKFSYDNVVAVIVEISRSGDEKPHDTYAIGEVGVVGMYFQYPPLVDVPPAPVAEPAYMTAEQGTELCRVRAEKVVEFIKSVIETAQPN